MTPQSSNFQELYNGSLYGVSAGIIPRQQERQLAVYQAGKEFRKPDVHQMKQSLKEKSLAALKSRASNGAEVVTYGYIRVASAAVRVS